MLSINMMPIFAEATSAALSSNQLAETLLPLVVILGFGAVITLGSIAWYNSKRPLGWEDKKRPNVVPEVSEPENPGIGTP
jgi:hypothetical protein